MCIQIDLILLSLLWKTNPICSVIDIILGVINDDVWSGCTWIKDCACLPSIITTINKASRLDALLIVVITQWSRRRSVLLSRRLWWRVRFGLCVLVERRLNIV